MNFNGSNNFQSSATIHILSHYARIIQFNVNLYDKKLSAHFLEVSTQYLLNIQYGGIILNQNKHIQSVEDYFDSLNDIILGVSDFVIPDL